MTIEELQQQVATETNQALFLKEIAVQLTEISWLLHGLVNTIKQVGR
jgi:hypothetical protein